MIAEAVAWIACVAMISASALAGWRMWLESQPACTAEEWQRVVKQVNTLTEGMTTLNQHADSVRTAVGLAGLGRKHG